MPYGVSKSVGGDSEGNDHFVESRVKSIREHNPHMTKSEAIAIAKKQLDRHHKARREHG